MAHASEDELYLVYRSGYEWPAGKRIVRLSVTGGALEWFRAGCRAAQTWPGRDEEDDRFYEAASAWIEHHCGGGVCGLAGIFHAARWRGISEPTTDRDLGLALSAHLNFLREGPELADGTVRFLSDDGEVCLGVFFVPMSYASSAPERCNFLLRKSWQLPAAVELDPAPFAWGGDQLREVELGGRGPGWTCVISLTDEYSQFVPELEAGVAVRLVPGVRIPDLEGHLRRVADPPDGWPDLLRALHSALDSGGPDLSAAFASCVALGVDQLANPEVSYERSGESRLHLSTHLIQLALENYVGDTHANWYVFDDLWAGSHPELAESLLRFATHWDPLRPSG